MDFQQYQVKKMIPNLALSTIQSLYTKYTNICARFLDLQQLKMGEADGSIVEMDESLFGKKSKYNRGARTKKHWVFGLMERGSRKTLFQVRGLSNILLEVHSYL